MEFVVSILLWPSLPSLTCCCKFWSGFTPAEFPGLELSCKCLWLSSTSTEFPGSGAPKPAEELAQAYSFNGPRLMLGLIEVSSFCLFALMSQNNAWNHRSLGPVIFPLSFRLIPGPTEMSFSCLLQWSLQIHIQTSGDPGSGLLPCRFQIHVWTHRVPGLGLLP